ncbi:unnamed protein product [Clonostachys byssicola]|uniref:Uncharacterized protein n=1 Tax=Clonostachys byssicola TaxID=160290 RepID=A0A9N9U1L5_9HYPO|nr:unnamed protein product [Clonostachys byssicola]
MYYISRTARVVPANAVGKTGLGILPRPAHQPTSRSTHCSPSQLSSLFLTTNIGVVNRLALMSVGWCDKLTAPRLTRANGLDDDASTNINTQLRRSTNAMTPLLPFFARPLLSSPYGHSRFYFSLQR